MLLLIVNIVLMLIQICKNTTIINLFYRTISLLVDQITAQNLILSWFSLRVAEEFVANRNQSSLGVQNGSRAFREQVNDPWEIETSRRASACREWAPSESRL